MTATSRESVILQAVIAVVVALSVNAIAVGGGASGDKSGGAPGDKSGDTSDAALRSYLAGNGLLNRGLYEPAAAEYRSFLAEHGDHEKAAAARYGLGVCLFRLEKYDEAATELATLRRLADFPYSAEAGVIEGQCHLTRGRYAEAAAAFEDVLKKGGNPEMADDAAAGAAEALYRSGKYEDAAARCRELASRWPDCPLRERGEFFWAMSEIGRGEYSSAAKRLGKAIDQYPQSALRAEMHFDRAVALLRAGEADAAIMALREFTSKFAEHALAAEALQLLATAEHQQGQYDKSRADAKAFLEKYPKDAKAASAAVLAAENEFLSEKYAESVESYRGFLSRYADDPLADKARLRLGTALYRLGQLDEAETWFEKVAPAAQREEVFRPALAALGDIHFQRGEWKKAEERLAAYLAVAGDGASADDALMKLAYAKQREEKNEEALRDYDRLIERFPKSRHVVQALFERGQIMVTLKRVDEAKQSFDRVLAEGGDSRFAAPSLNHLAAMALQRNDAAEAAGLYGRAAKIAGGGEEEIEAVLRQGQALMADGQYAPAETAFRHVVELGGKSAVAAEARARLAIAVSRQDRYAEALTFIDTVDNESGGANSPAAPLRTALAYEKAWCLRALGKSEDAVKAYREVLGEAEGGSVSLHAMLELAELESAAKHYEAAAEVLRGLKEALAKDQASSPELREQCLYRLGVCEFERGRFEDSAGALEELISTFPKGGFLASASFYAGEALFRAGRHEKAIAHLTRVTKDFASDPIAPPAMLRLGECEAVLQRWALSEQAYKDYLDRFSDREQWFAAQFGVGWARENLKRYDEAIAAYARVVERHQGPTAARAQFQIGQCLFAQKKYEAAVRELLKVDILYAYPEWSAAALYEAGRCFAELGDQPEARKQFTAVTEKFQDTKWAQLAGKQISELSAAASALPGG